MNNHYFKSFPLRLSCLLFFLLLQLSAGAKHHVLRILAIGNSFSEDAVENNLHELGKEQGTCIIVGNMYIGGMLAATPLDECRERYSSLSLPESEG